jgi:hypothetical protein
MNQVDMFHTPSNELHRSTDCETSREAAESIDTSRMESLVYDIVVASGSYGTTLDEVTQKMQKYGDFESSSISPRIAPLIRKGLLEKTGDKRKGKRGRNQQVVRAV